MIYGKNYNCRKEHYLQKYKNAEFINKNSSEDIYKLDKANLREEINAHLQQIYGIKPIFFTENEELTIDYTTNLLKSQEKVLIGKGMLKNDLGYYTSYDYIYKDDNSYTIIYILYKSFEKIHDYATKNSLIPKLLYTTDIIRNVLGQSINLKTQVISLEINEETKRHYYELNDINLSLDFKPYDLNKYYPLYYTDTEEPKCEYSRKCKKCGFRDYCGVPKFSIADLESTPNCWRVIDPIIKNHDDLRLESLTVEEVNTLKDYQKFRYYAHMSENGIWIVKNAIKVFLDKIFKSGYVSFDFETYSSVIPISEKYKTYAQIPFSYSADIVSRDNKIISHNIYITDYKDENFDKLIEHLVQDIPTDLPIVVYFQSFEKSRLTELKELYPQYADTIDMWINNLVDLYEVFALGGYYDIKFGNSISLKSVYPVLCGNKYEELDINKGDKALLDYKMIFNDKHIKDADKIMEDLKKYNSQDTMAQVEIIEKLKNMII